MDGNAATGPLDSDSLPIMASCDSASAPDRPGATQAGTSSLFIIAESARTTTVTTTTSKFKLKRTDSRKQINVKFYKINHSMVKSCSFKFCHCKCRRTAGAVVVRYMDLVPRTRTARAVERDSEVDVRRLVQY